MQRKRVAVRAAFATWLILSIFAVAGGLIFKAFGISLGAFKIAGGLMLLLMSVDMMRAQPSRTRTSDEEQNESRDRDDIAIFPLAIPMLAGPGAIATVMVLMSRAAWDPVRTPSVFIAVTVTCVVAWLLMRGAANAERWLPKTLLRAFERVMGLLLAAVAIEFIAGGVRDLIANVS
jgi:multiple antibiotic resistance protein